MDYIEKTNNFQTIFKNIIYIYILKYRNHNQK